jgi:uncharacterized protein YhbP (UPF0306 family)
MTMREQALQYLQNHHVMTLATVDPAGVWAAALFYTSQEFDIFFLSAAHTRHAQNVITNPKVSATIQENYTDWTQIKGIQLEGTVIQLHGQQKKEAINHYLAHFPFIQNAGQPIEKALAKVSWYCLTPQKLYFIDNSKGFGQREEILLTEK